MNQVAQIEQRLAERITPETSRQVAIRQESGGVVLQDAAQAMEFAKMMAVGGVAVPKHLRGNPGACLAVVIQAVEWRMSPFAVANKSYSVNDRLAYESQLIHAVVQSRAPIRGRVKVEYAGEGDKRTCRVWAELRDEPGEIVDYTSPPFGKIQPKNSPLWKTDPDQQHFYYSVRAWARRNFPDVIMGVVAEDELPMRDVTPRSGPPRQVPPPAAEAVTGEIVEDARTEPEPETVEPNPAADPEAILAEFESTVAAATDPSHVDEAVEAYAEDDLPREIRARMEAAADAARERLTKRHVEEAQDDAAEGSQEPPIDPESPEYKRGQHDRRNGIKRCISSAIREDERKFANWKAGWEAAA